MNQMMDLKKYNVNKKPQTTIHENKKFIKFIKKTKILLVFTPTIIM